MNEKLIFMRQYLKTDPKQSLEQFRDECVGLFHKKMGQYPNRCMCPVGDPSYISIPFTQSKLCRPNNLFLWYEESKE